MSVTAALAVAGVLPFAPNLFVEPTACPVRRKPKPRLSTATREREKRRVDDRYGDRKARGVCVNCGSRAAEGGRVRCETCSQKLSRRF